MSSPLPDHLLALPVGVFPAGAAVAPLLPVLFISVVPPEFLPPNPCDGVAEPEPPTVLPVLFGTEFLKLLEALLRGTAAV